MDERMLVQCVKGEFRMGYNARNPIVFKQATIAKGLVASGDFNAEAETFVSCLRGTDAEDAQEIVGMLNACKADVSLEVLCAMIPFACKKKRVMKRNRVDTFGA